jgi:hypothetical protein
MIARNLPSEGSVASVRFFPFFVVCFLSFELRFAALERFGNQRIR